MNVSTVKKRIVPINAKRYEYRYEKSNVVNDFEMLVFQIIGKDKFQMVGIFQYFKIRILEQQNGYKYI